MPGPRHGKRQSCRWAARGSAPSVTSGPQGKAWRAERLACRRGSQPPPSECPCRQSTDRAEPRSKRGSRRSSRPRLRPPRTETSGPARCSSRQSKAPGGTQAHEVPGPPRAKPRCRAAGCPGYTQTESSAPNREGGPQPSRGKQHEGRTGNLERRPGAKQGQRMKTMPRPHARGARSCARRPTGRSRAANPSLITKQGTKEERGRAGRRRRRRGRGHHAGAGAEMLREEPERSARPRH